MGDQLLKVQGESVKGIDFDEVSGQWPAGRWAAEKTYRNDDWLLKKKIIGGFLL